MIAAPLLLALLAGRVSPSEAAYQKARHAFYALKADRQKRRDRDHWLAAAGSFEKVAARFPRSPRAPQALFTAAELRAELSRLSFVAADRRSALADYRRVARVWPRSALADDALYQAARIELLREDDPEAARADLERILRRYPRGDMVRRARVLLATLPKAPKRREVRGAGGATPGKAAQRSDGRLARAAPPARPEELAAPPAEVAGGEGEGRARGGAAAARFAAAPAGKKPGGEDKAGARWLAGFLRDPAARPAGPGTGKAAPLSTRALAKAGPAPGGVPLAVQMGLRVHRIVIDAGHGGHDAGAIGPHGTREKDVTLAIAKRLARELSAAGFEVLLTRGGDRFVPLEGRAEFANDHKADLFISIHANANTDREQHGVQTYFLDVTNDRYAIRLAARENQSSERSISDLQLILADLAQKSDTEESHRLATAVQRALVAGEEAPDRGVRHALFYVLLGVRMPAILVETAFVSNPREERRLRSAAFQQEVAKDIAAGVERFVHDRRELAGL